jgi:hypothetical protein
MMYGYDDALDDLSTLSRMAWNSGEGQNAMDGVPVFSFGSSTFNTGWDGVVNSFTTAPASGDVRHSIVELGPTHYGLNESDFDSHRELIQVGLLDILGRQG